MASIIGLSMCGFLCMIIIIIGIPIAIIGLIILLIWWSAHKRKKAVEDYVDAKAKSKLYDEIKEKEKEG